MIYKGRLSSMMSMMLVLYANDLKNRYGNVTPATFTKFFETIDKYSDTSATVPIYKDGMCEWTPNGAFKELFGGNSNAITTIFTVFNLELEKAGLSSFVYSITQNDDKPAFFIQD